MGILSQRLMAPLSGAISTILSKKRLGKMWQKMSIFIRWAVLCSVGLVATPAQLSRLSRLCAWAAARLAAPCITSAPTHVQIRSGASPPRVGPQTDLFCRSGTHQGWLDYWTALQTFSGDDGVHIHGRVLALSFRHMANGGRIASTVPSGAFSPGFSCS